MRRRKPVKESIPENLSTLIEKILGQNNALLPFREKRFLNQCLDRLGEEFCSHLTPRRFKNGILYCLVDSPTWVQQYQFLSKEMLDRLNNPPLEHRVDGLRFTIGSQHDSDYINRQQDQVENRKIPGLTKSEARDLNKAIDHIHTDLQIDLRNLVRGWTENSSSGQDSE